MPAPFYYHPRMLAYDFGPRHPLRPERLHRAVVILERYGFESTDPGQGDVADVLRVHDPAFVDYVRQGAPDGYRFGFGPGDNPPFEGMFDASLAYVAGSAAAARRVCEGAPLAISLSGGLHHARRAEASGFCIFNDPAIALHILRERFERVAYVDIDVHHGDGVQWLWYDDPSVLTCSIHQDGRTLYPGTGGVEETGAEHSSVNVPMAPGTTGDVWLWAFEEVIMAALRRFQPQAIVLQMGTDAHFSDPLARLQVTAREWTGAVRMVRDFGVPIVAVGGGGYAITAVPRMWAAACLTLCAVQVPENLPEDLDTTWNMPYFFDAPVGSGEGRDYAESVVRWHSHHQG